MVSKSPNSSDIDKWIAAIERAASRSGIDTNIYFLSVQAAISGKMLSGRHRAAEKAWNVFAVGGKMKRLLIDVSSAVNPVKA